MTGWAVFAVVFLVAAFWVLAGLTRPSRPEPTAPTNHPLQSVRSPCRAPDCPADRYAPLDEHSITAHHRWDNARTPRTWKKAK